jgi:hypothetical protein
MMAKFVLILYVPGIPALSMSDIDFDFGGVWPKEIIKSNRDCLYVLVRNVTLLLLLLLLSTHLNIFRVSGEIEIQQTLMSRDPERFLVKYELDFFLGCQRVFRSTQVYI